MMLSKTVDIFLLCYNRPDYAQLALQSIQNQTYKDIRIIVSDNSPSDIVYHALRPLLNECEYVHRQPSLPPLAHFNQVLSEVRGDFFIMFHDDDIMMPNCVETLVGVLSKYPQAAAAASNAIEFSSDVKSGVLFNNQIPSELEVKSFDELVNRYSDCRFKIMPFPAYLYRRGVAYMPRLERRNGRKYSDVAFLLEYIKNGPIVWIERPGIYYRRHPGNDSNMVDMAGVVLLAKYIMKNTNDAATRRLVEELVYGMFFSWLRQNWKRKFRKRDWVMCKKLIMYLIRNPRFVIIKTIGKLLWLFRILSTSLKENLKSKNIEM